MTETTRHRMMQGWKFTKELSRMVQWLAFGAALYFIVFDKQIGLQDSNPGLQASLYTLANITVRAWLGYRISVALIGKLKDGEHWMSFTQAQAIAFGAAILGRAILVGFIVGTSR